MKVTVFNGSPRAKNSNTDVIAQAFLKGAERAGAETETVYLIEKTINHCNGCFNCWFKSPGRCIHNDDMSELINKYNKSEIVCFATPVYTWNMTAALKNFVDRLAPLKSPVLKQNNGNYDLEDSKKKESVYVVVANSGFPGENNFNVMRQVFSSCNPVLEIYRNCGMLLKREDEKIKIKEAEYLEYVATAGYELVKQGAVNDDTINELEKELVPLDEYIKFLQM